jgi:5'-nucleotidase
MHVLLTNDDGIAAPGLWVAARALANLGSVLIVAPSADCSGYGAALPPAQTLSYRPYGGDTRLPRVAAYALDSTPAACAHVGLSGALDDRPIDLVVSGVNAGANLGRDVLYSGTVGAALTARLLGTPAIAVSLDIVNGDVPRWDAATWAIRQMVERWRALPEPEPVVYNVNVPNRPAAMLAGARITALSDHSFLSQYEFTAEPGSATLTAVRSGLARRSASPAWSDSQAVAEGFVAITPLRPFADILGAARRDDAARVPLAFAPAERSLKAA